MADYLDPEDALTHEPPVPVPSPIEAPEPEESDDSYDATDETIEPKKPRLNKGAKKK